MIYLNFFTLLFTLFLSIFYVFSKKFVKAILLWENFGVFLKSASKIVSKPFQKGHRTNRVLFVGFSASGIARIELPICLSASGICFLKKFVRQQAGFTDFVKKAIFYKIWDFFGTFWDFPLKQYCGNTYFFYTFFTKLLNLWTSIYQSGIRYLLASKRLSLTHFYNHLCNFPAVKHFL